MDYNIKEWTKAEETEMQTYKEMNISNMKFLAEKFNRTVDSVDHKRRRMNIPYIREDQPTKNDIAKAQVDIVYQIQEELSKTKPYPKVISTLKSKGDTLVINFTDWHVGRIVKDEVGRIIYDEKVFQERIDILLNEILTLLDDYISKGTPIADVVILSTGDIADGQGIFATQDTLSEMSPPFQVMTAVKVIQRFILSLTERNLKVSFYGVKGNHGEIRENGKSHDPLANWDLMIYLILDMWVRIENKHKDVQIHYSELDYLNLEIQGWKYHIRHIAPNQAETGGPKGKVLGWARKHDFDCLVYGHFHHWAVYDRSGIIMFRGGSVPGADEFSEQLAEESKPTQLIWGVCPKRPMTFLYSVDLGKVEK